MLKGQIEFDFLKLGAMLMQIKGERMYEAGWSSWEEFTMELRMSETTISRLINIYQVFHVQYRVPMKQLVEAGGYSVIAEYLPLVNEKTTREQVNEWITQASTLTRADVRRTIVEARKGVDMAKCKHPNSYKIMCCPDCGDRQRI